MTRDHRIMHKKAYREMKRREEIEANITAVLASILGWAVFYFFIFFG